MKDKGDREYYDEKFSLCDPAQKVGWKDHTAQYVRFKQFLPLFVNHQTFGINDLGCGLAHFYDFLVEHGYREFIYKGYDRDQRMIEHCVAAQVGKKKELVLIHKAEEMDIADFTIASGIFNLKFEIAKGDWESFIFETIETMNRKSRLGFGFNILSKYSDKEFQKNELYYADPCFFLDHCLKHYSKNIDLKHGYGQYDFTILVYKG